MGAKPRYLFLQAKKGFKLRMLNLQVYFHIYKRMFQNNGIYLACFYGCRRMDNKEEDGVDDDASDRDTRQTTSDAGRWKGRGRFGTHSHNQYYGGHRDRGA